MIHIFAGGECVGDVHEATLLERAINDAHESAIQQAAVSQQAAAPLLSCSCTIVPGSDHAVAAAMRVSGELNEVLTHHCK